MNTFFQYGKFPAVLARIFPYVTDVTVTSGFPPPRVGGQHKGNVQHCMLLHDVRIVAREPLMHSEPLMRSRPAPPVLRDRRRYSPSSLTVFPLLWTEQLPYNQGHAKDRWAKYNGAIPGRECDSHILGGNLPPRDADSIFPEPGPEINPARCSENLLEI